MSKLPTPIAQCFTRPRTLALTVSIGGLLAACFSAFAYGQSNQCEGTASQCQENCEITEDLLNSANDGLIHSCQSFLISGTSSPSEDTEDTALYSCTCTSIEDPSENFEDPTEEPTTPPPSPIDPIKPTGDPKPVIPPTGNDIPPICVTNPEQKLRECLANVRGGPASDSSRKGREACGEQYQLDTKNACD